MIEAVEQGDKELFDLRDRIQETGDELRGAYDVIERQNPDMFEELRKEPIADQPRDELYRQYQEIINNPELDDPVAGYDWARREREVAAFRQAIGAENWQYIENRTQQDRAEYPRLVRDYWDAIERLQTYWEVPDRILASQPLRYAQYKTWQSLSRAEKDIYADLVGLNPVLDGITEARQTLRDLRPDIDGLLSTWYGDRFKLRR